MYKIVHGYEKIQFSNFTFPVIAIPGVHTRRQEHKLNIELVTNCPARFNFFTNRAAKLWNNLKTEDSNAISLNSFKAILSSRYDY